MNAILLTVLALNGADLSNASMGAGAGYCAECDGAYGGHCRPCHSGICHPMPQSCYNPSFGCYPSTRFMHRYPAFHGYYYRSAYNYRHYFEYPWHAGLHEPTSHFSHHVTGASPAPQDALPPPPMPERGN